MARSGRPWHASGSRSSRGLRSSQPATLRSGRRRTVLDAAEPRCVAVGVPAKVRLVARPPRLLDAAVLRGVRGYPLRSLVRRRVARRWMARRPSEKSLSSSALELLTICLRTGVRLVGIGVFPDRSDGERGERLEDAWRSGGGGRQDGTGWCSPWRRPRRVPRREVFSASREGGLVVLGSSWSVPCGGEKACLEGGGMGCFLRKIVRSGVSRETELVRLDKRRRDDPWRSRRVLRGVRPSAFLNGFSAACPCRSWQRVRRDLGGAGVASF